MYIVDCYANVKSEKVKITDDGTIWRTGTVWLELVKGLEEDFKWIMKWAKQWRLKLSIGKTEFCVFSQTIQYNPRPKILGVTLDEKLKFDVHTEQIERKALRSLDLLRRVKETESIITKCMLQLSAKTQSGWTLGFHFCQKIVLMVDMF